MNQWLESDPNWQGNDPNLDGMAKGINSGKLVPMQDSHRWHSVPGEYPTKKFGKVQEVDYLVRALAKACVGPNNTVHDVQGMTVRDAANELITTVGNIFA